MNRFRKWEKKVTSTENDILMRGIMIIAQSKLLWEENQSFSFEDFILTKILSKYGKYSKISKTHNITAFGKSDVMIFFNCTWITI